MRKVVTVFNPFSKVWLSTFLQYSHTDSAICTCNVFSELTCKIKNLLPALLLPFDITTLTTALDSQIAVTKHNNLPLYQTHTKLTKDYFCALLPVHTADIHYLLIPLLGSGWACLSFSGFPFITHTIMFRQHLLVAIKDTNRHTRVRKISLLYI